MLTIVYGASGHAKVITGILRSRGMTAIQYWDDAVKPPIMGMPVMQPPPEDNASYEMVIAIGNNKIRKMIAERYAARMRFVAAIHASAVVAPEAAIGAGTVVMPQAVVNEDTVIGEHAIINSGAVIEHDCRLGDFVHVSPNATLCGNVHVGEGTHIGAGATLIPGVRVGKWCTIGAGAVVIRDIPDHVTAVGNPARVIRQEDHTGHSYASGV